MVDQRQLSGYTEATLAPCTELYRLLLQKRLANDAHQKVSYAHLKSRILQSAPLQCQQHS